jgi:hypothetical protein
MDCLRYWVTPHGLQPWKKKVDAILKMECPQNIKQLRSFIGVVVDYYHALWPHQYHVLKPLTDLTGKGTWEWHPEHKQAFKEMKALAALDVVMLYPDHNSPFKIYTDAPNYQVGACIMQHGMSKRAYDP